jgi:hypothetical protein
LSNSSGTPGAAAGQQGSSPSSAGRLLTHQQARSLAESLWGTGGTNASRTNRAGTFYFSCSGHGGFVIDDRALTGPERDLLGAAGFRPENCWGARGKDGTILGVRHPYSDVPHPRPVKYSPGRGDYEDRAIPLWFFEEDTEWAAVYVFTAIRRATEQPEAEMTGYAMEVLGRWHEQAFRLAQQLAARDSSTPAAGAAAAPARRRSAAARQPRTGRRRTP